MGKIEPLPIGSLAGSLTRGFSYVKQGSEFMPNPQWGIIKLYNIRMGKFPWGLKDRVYNIIKNKGYNVSFEDESKVELDYGRLKNLDPGLRDYQKDAILALILNNGGLVCLPTGSGKSRCFMGYARYMDKKTLIIVPTLDLVKQWKGQIKKGDKIEVINHHKLVKNKDKLKEYDIVAYDEAHMTPAKTVYNIMQSTGDAINIGLTATPYRESGDELKIFAAVGDLVYSKSRRELIEQGYLADADIKYIKLDSHEKSRFIKYPEIYNSMIVENKERNNKICKAVKKNPYKKILILVSRIEHGKILNKLLLDNNIKNNFLNGMMKDRDIKDEDKVIIATSIFDMGVDLKNFDALILAAGGQSSVQLVQRIGRVLRPKEDGRKSLIYDFMDESKYLKVHYKKRRKILSEEFDVEEIEGL